MERKKDLNINYFHIFGCKYFIHNNKKDNLCKFDAKVDESIFLGYSTSSKVYRLFNKRTLVVEKSIHIIFDEANDLSSRKKDIFEDDTEILENKIKELNLKERSTQNGDEGTKDAK